MLVKKSEFVSGKHIVSVVPETLRQLWRARWFEAKCYGTETQLASETKNLLLSAAMAVQQPNPSSDLCGHIE